MQELSLEQSLTKKHFIYVSTPCNTLVSFNLILFPLFLFPLNLKQSNRPSEIPFFPHVNKIDFELVNVTFLVRFMHPTERKMEKFPFPSHGNNKTISFTNMELSFTSVEIFPLENTSNISFGKVENYSLRQRRGKR